MKGDEPMRLTEAQVGKEYTILKVDTNDDEMNAFLFSLGCYSGEPITVISRLRHSAMVAIKDSRYNIDRALSDAIQICS